MIFTSVLGHLFHLNFVKKYRWEEIEPSSLFYEPVIRTISDETIKKNIENQVRYANKVVIWTDCDREGENIAKQIESVVLAIKSVEVFRARFSGISTYEIQKSYDDLKTINNAEADAVDARMELDLKIGSAFTIFQTLCLKNLFNSKKIVSFGPCQIPTLGFVVERYEAIENHVGEKYWSLKLHSTKTNTIDIFNWKRDRVFDYNCAVYFNNLLEDLPAIITKVEESPTTKLKPLPLRTVELQKICSSIFKVSSHKIMTIAEKLYNQGFISYPRTETDSFDTKFNFKNILENLKKDGSYLNAIENIQKDFKYPRKGKNNDMAHSPIYPLKGGSSLSGLERSIFDFISRRFLGGLCDDAKGLEKTYEATVGREVFIIKSHKILHKNYLNVYTYDTWAEKEVNDYVLGEQLKSRLEMDEHETEPPPFLTESDLIALMDKNGIGTDATIHEHIQKIQEREYARKEGGFIIPEKFGIALIRGYKNLNLDFSGPVLRKDLEIKLKEVCNSNLEKNQLVNEEIRTYHKLYDILKQNQGKFYDFISNYIKTSNRLIEKRLKRVGGGEDEGGNSGGGSGGGNNGGGSGGGVTLKRPYITKPTTKAPTTRPTTINSTTRPTTTRPTSKASTITTNPNTESTNREPKKRKPTEQIFNKENKDNKFYCNCGKPAIKSETKSGDNKGKMYYTCPEGVKKCGYFKWASEDGKCHCGFDPIELVSKTENNKGRRFLKCKKAYKPCKFFEWAD
ncbi:DNA topoisomerase 3-alpha [Nosema bombycis CQ1]|uniref:DNA topoisomerase n=1 Tax=Nosema bombycis (strain CQ1 / CVCC 102059) TaxID=578461 RepID=R0MEX3_NOSB1|nr:DNA topoisomerase 3-alpha [Nosema bombycis CQ1]|eukprot:EOB11308.1 DNA topoisomerase 3-alpha [Nosema bombycis CQ1]